MTTVSITACTHNRRVPLAGCRASLVADASSVGWELLVVDNASTDGTSEYLQEFAARSLPFPAYYALEPAVGLSNGRTGGLRETTSEFVLFTGSDRNHD